MADDPVDLVVPIDPVEAYVREYFGRYSTESIRRQLLNAGFEPERIEAAIQKVSSQPAPASHLFFKAVLISACILVALAILAFGVCVYQLRSNGFR